MALYFCVNKQDYFIDEIYSYVLSNSYDCDSFSNSDEIKEQWIDGKSLEEFVTVQLSERFAYNKTYLNNTTDAHPPFYYFLLHTVCSLFPNMFSKWFGVSINILFFILTQIVLFKLSCDVFKNTIWKLLPVALYGFIPITFDVMLLIRMYSVLTFFTVLLFFIHFRMIQGAVKYPYPLCLSIVFLGTFTQYFFAISAFYLALCYLLYLLKNKKIRDMLVYSASMLAGVLLVFILYPAAVTQITGSETNNIGNEVSANILNFTVLPRHIYAYFQQFIERTVSSSYLQKIIFSFFPDWHWLFGWIAIVCISVALFFIVKIRVKKEKINNILVKNNVAFMLSAFVIVVLTVITTAHISGEFAYIRYIYNLVPMIILTTLGAVYYIVIKKNKAKIIGSILMIIAFVCGAGTFIKQNCEYLLKDRYQVNQKTIEYMKGRPLVVFSKGAAHILTANYTLLSNVDSLFITDKNKVDIDLLSAQVDSSNGIFLMVLTDTYWANGYDGEKMVRSILNSSQHFTSFKEYGEESFSTIYLIK